MVLNHSDTLESGSFEHRINLAHRGEGFNPVNWAQCTSLPQKRGCDPGTPIRRMQDNALQQPELTIQPRERNTRTGILELKVSGSERK
jgi:hypothetical protein